MPPHSILSAVNTTRKERGERTLLKYGLPPLSSLPLSHLMRKKRNVGFRLAPLGFAYFFVAKAQGGKGGTEARSSSPGSSLAIRVRMRECHFVKPAPKYHSSSFRTNGSIFSTTKSSSSARVSNRPPQGGQLLPELHSKSTEQRPFFSASPPPLPPPGGWTNG